MRWPWTSVARLDDRDRAVAQRDDEIGWLRERVSYLEEQLNRRERRAMGMPEIARETRRNAQPIDMPSELVQYIKRYGTPALQKMQLREAIKRHVAGESWDVIKEDIMREQAPDLQEAL